MGAPDLFGSLKGFLVLSSAPAEGLAGDSEPFQVELKVVPACVPFQGSELWWLRWENQVWATEERGTDFVQATCLLGLILPLSDSKPGVSAGGDIRMSPSFLSRPFTPSRGPHWGCP